MQKYKWNVLNEKAADSLDEIIKDILLARKIDNPEDFLNIKHPLDFAQDSTGFIDVIEKINLAIKLIKETMSKNLSIVIHGDYDVDGQSATAIIWRTIYNDLNYKNVYPFIPNRFDHGYGLSESSLNDITKLLTSKSLPIKNALILTVDCGITANKETKLAKDKGFNIIITDHHSKADNIPVPDVLVWTDKATGAGIAWLLSVTLLDQRDSKYLDLACLGAICDLLPLTGFNRSVVKYGLQESKQNKILGINVLKDIANVKNDLDTYEIGWIIGPLLNASGRLEDATNSLRLLSTDSLLQAIEISKKLYEINKVRQDKTLKDYLYANEKYEKLENLPTFIYTESTDYHDGIIGLVAGKLTQTYTRPAIAVAIETDKGIAKGSGRSIIGIPITETLRKFNELFENLGGHDQACGFSIKIEKLGELKKRLKELDNQFDDSLFEKKLNIDTILNENHLNIDLYHLIQTLKPFGVGFTEPVFASKNYKINNIYKFGQENKHLKFELRSPSGSIIYGVMFNGSEDLQKLQFSDTVNIAYTLSLNTWNDKNTLELKIRDIKL